jgi:hypothetical protein
MFVDFFLDGELDLDSSGVWLGPDEGNVNKLDFVEASHSSETNSHKLLGFKFGVYPRRTKVSLTESAEVEDSLFGYAI